MQASNSGLQRLITKFTTDPDRQLRSVFESVQYQNSLVREARKTSMNFMPRVKPSHTVPGYGPSNWVRDSQPRMPLMSRNLNPTNALVNRNLNEGQWFTPIFEMEALESIPQPQNGIYLNLEKDSLFSRSRQRCIKRSGFDPESEEVPRSFLKILAYDGKRRWTFWM